MQEDPRVVTAIGDFLGAERLPNPHTVRRNS
jgi:hypothetical protein